MTFRYYNYDDPAFIEALRAALKNATSARPTTDWAFNGEDEVAYWDGLSFLDAGGIEIAKIGELSACIYTHDTLPNKEN